MRELRYGIVADIHGNLAAFEAVLADMGDVDELWCLGDLVGYGPDPNECVELLRSRPHRCVVGNHDLAAVGRIDTSEFNPDAAHAATWTGTALSAATHLYLSSLEQRIELDPFTLVHGSPRQPVWEYIVDERRARANFDHFATVACLVGHSHIPALYVDDVERGLVMGRIPGPGERVVVADDRFIANPGGVGQPRDGDPRAAYAVYEAGARTLEWRRVPYPIEVTQQRMRDLGLPRRLIERLSYGM